MFTFAELVLNLGYLLLGAGLYREAVPVIEEAIRDYRLLARVLPAKSNPLLAKAMRISEVAYEATGKRTEAAKARHESDILTEAQRAANKPREYHTQLH